MKYHLLKIIILVFIIINLSCDNEKDNYAYDTFLVHVDSIKLPDKISSNIPFDIEFYGTVGNNGCNSFLKFVTRKNNHEIIVETWGEYESYGVCPLNVVMLDGKKLNYTIENAGNYLLKIKQPDDSYLDKEISVE